MVKESANPCQASSEFFEFLAGQSSGLVNSSNLDRDIKQILIDHKSKNPAFHPSFCTRQNIDAIAKAFAKDDRKDYFVKIFPGYTELKCQDRNRAKDMGGGVRKPITKFSRSSRNNFIKKILRLRDLPNLWMTLTFADSIIDRHFNGEYPGYEVLCERIKYDFNRWSKFTENLHDWNFWRVEHKPRLSGPYAGCEFPHMHVMIKADRKEMVPHALLAKWHQVSCPGDEKHKQVTMHKRSYDWLDGNKKIFGYCSKYCAKEDQEIEIFDPETGEVRAAEIGRCWGFSRNAPVADPEVKRIGKKLFADLKRTARKHIKSICREARAQGKKRSISHAMNFKLKVRDASFSWYLPATLFSRLLHPPSTPPDPVGMRLCHAPF